MAPNHTQRTKSRHLTHGHESNRSMGSWVLTLRDTRLSTSALQSIEPLSPMNSPISAESGIVWDQARRKSLRGNLNVYNPLAPSPPFSESRHLFPLFPPPALSPQLHASKPCLTPRRSLGLGALTLRRSRTGSTLERRGISQDVSSARLSMVRKRVYPCIHSHLVCSIYYLRDCHRSVLPMYGCVARFCKPHRGSR